LPMVDAELWKTVAVTVETFRMDTQSDLKWIPATGIQLRKAGVQFDAVRVDGDEGRDLADRLARMTGGAPGPVVEEATGNRAVYFLVPVGSTSHRPWPPGVTASPPARTTCRTSRSRPSTARLGP
jgi:hypothetical protein